MSKHTQPKRKKEKNKKKRWIIALSVVLVIVLALVLAVNGILGKINRIGQEEQIDPNDQTFQTDENDANSNAENMDPSDVIWKDVNTINADGVVKILLIGCDARGNERGRSDSLMLATVSKDTGEVTLTSFLRDTYVQIPGYADNRINASYSSGGTQLLKKTLKQNFGLDVDGCVVINFQNFEKVIDLVGGVEITLTKAEANYMNNHNETGKKWNLKEGKQTLSGQEALFYARIRYIDSDFGRTNRQRTVLQAIYNAKKNISIADAGTLINEILPLITTDMTNSQILSYATLVLKLKVDSLKSFYIPAEGTYTNQKIRGMSVLVPDLEMNNKLLEGYMHGKDLHSEVVTNAGKGTGTTGTGTGTTGGKTSGN